MSGIADVATKVWGDLKDGRRSAPVHLSEPRLRSVRKKKLEPPPEPAPEPDGTARMLLALRHYLDKGMALDEAVAAANWALRRGNDSL